VPEWYPSLDDVMHWVRAGGGWPTLDSLEYEVTFIITRVTFVFGETRSPPIGQYDSEPTKLCNLNGYGDHIRKINFGLFYLMGCKDYF